MGDPEKEFERYWRRTRRTKFLVDENLGKGTAQLLRETRKVNVEFAADVGLGGRDDCAVFAYAWRKRRVLLTHDRGFLDDTRFPEHRNPGVVVLPGGEGDEEALVRALYFAMLLVEQNPTAWAGTKITAQADGEVRIKQRHAETGAMETRRYKLGGLGPALIWED
jgi:predicted nuclease of predicted toxin-antitoxin system